MGKCTIIGRIRAPANIGQAVRINGLKCDEETLWTLDNVFGGESVVTDFYIENRSGVTFTISFDISTATEGEYTAGVYLPDGVTLVSSPTVVLAKATDNFKFQIDFDKYITEDTHEIIIEFDFV
jgi:hypothetical protein